MTTACAVAVILGVAMLSVEALSPPPSRLTFQTRLLHGFWSCVTRLGTRRLGDQIKKWYPSAYGGTLFYVDMNKDIAHCSLIDQEGSTEMENSLQPIAVTIDDGVCRGQDDSISMIQDVCCLLKEYHARATFFVCTDYTTRDDVRLILEEGHELGNHLKKDVSGYYYKLSQSCFSRELKDANHYLNERTEEGQKEIKWFRAPQGLMSPAMKETLRQENMVHVPG